MRFMREGLCSRAKSHERGAAAFASYSGTYVSLTNIPNSELQYTYPLITNSQLVVFAFISRVGYFHFYCVR